jgi:DNA-binding MarR family transcriptional regulator
MSETCLPSGSPLAGLSGDEFALWAGFLQTHAALAQRLDADLRAAHGLPLGEFEILLWLANGPCERMRMAALAASVPLSPSGVSRAVERLEGRGLVRRDRCREDRRGAYAVLTARGIALVQAAGATHAAGIRRFFLDRLGAEEREVLARIWDHLDAGYEGDGARHEIQGRATRDPGGLEREKGDES